MMLGLIAVVALVAFVIWGLGGASVDQRGEADEADRQRRLKASGGCPDCAAEARSVVFRHLPAIRCPRHRTGTK